MFSNNIWRAFSNYVGVGKGSKEQNLDTTALLGEFINSRASHVAQTSLYGYMKTRAGTRYPDLFENPAILTSINIAKWQIWLACLSDLTVYAGVLIRNRTEVPQAQIKQLLLDAVDPVIQQVGTPGDAGDDYPATVLKVRQRIADCDLEALQDDGSAFTESPSALVYWSPIADELKNRDVEIVRNSVRFRWQEIRRSMRKLLQADILVNAANGRA